MCLYPPGHPKRILFYKKLFRIKDHSGLKFLKFYIVEWNKLIKKVPYSELPNNVENITTTS